MAIHHLAELGEISRQAKPFKRRGRVIALGAAFLYLLTGPGSDGRRRRRDHQQVCRTIFRTLRRANYSPRVIGARILLLSMTAPAHVSCKENHWELPRRWRMAGAFTTSLTGEFPTAGRRRPGEAAEADSPAIFVSADHPIEAVKIPTSGKAMEICIGRGRVMARSRR